MASSYASEIALVAAGTGKPFPSAPPGSVRLSSISLGWRNIIFERQRQEPRELDEHYVVGHGLTIYTGRRPIRFGWRGGRGWRDQMMNPGESHLLTQGELNTPRWLDTKDAVSLILDPHFVGIVADEQPADRVAFVTQRCVSDPTIVRYAEAFLAELAADGPNGALYADTLTIGFTLHLLSAYALRKLRSGRPRGKLSAAQLSAVVEFIQAHLADDVSLLTLAREANASPCHFARQFRATTGLAPHQFVLRHRVQRSIALMKAGKLPPAQIALATGFHDQPHLIRTFRRVLGTTPARYIAQG